MVGKLESASKVSTIVSELSLAILKIVRISFVATTKVALLRISPVSKP